MPAAERVLAGRFHLTRSRGSSNADTGHPLIYSDAVCVPWPRSRSEKPLLRDSFAQCLLGISTLDVIHCKSLGQRRQSALRDSRRLLMAARVNYM